MTPARLSAVFLLLSASAFARQVELQTELQRIVAPPPPNGNPFYNFEVGGAVAISDEWAAVADKTVQDATGEVYMYRRTSAGWMFSQRLVGEFQSGFGWSLAIEGDELVAGEPILGGYLGKVCVFQWTGAVWMKTQEILPENLSSGVPPRFGSALALSDDVLVIGAPLVDHPVVKGGEIRVYERKGGMWELTARFQLPVIPPVFNEDYFGLGTSLSVSGDTIVAGAGGNYGAAYVYARGSSGWARTAILDNPSPQSGDCFGASVAISGNTITVSQPAWNTIHPRPGLAYVYERDLTGSWNLEREIRASDGFGDGGDYGDEFGGSIAMAGGRIFVGAHNGQSTGYKNGAVYVFSRHGDGWHATEDYQFVASTPPPMGFGQVGHSVAAYENFVLTGAPGSWDGGIREGVAYTFAVELGDSYCTSSSESGVLAITGSEAADDRRLILTVRGAPASARGLFFLSASSGSYPFGGGTLCLGAPITRLGYILTGPVGIALKDLDFDAPWLDGLVAGSTWYFQCAHEREPGTGQLELITNAVALTLE
jgi:hypothetical protein